MKIPENLKLLFEAVQSKLTEDDDRNFWQAALTALTDEFLQRYDEEAKNREWVFVVGVCSHWVRPHNSSWKGPRRANVRVGRIEESTILR